MPTYYINADTGNDTTGNGSSGTPWKTFAKGLTSSTTGDTLYLQSATATYNFMYQSGSYAGGSYTARIIQGQSSSTVVFDGAGGSSIFHFSGNWSFSDVTFQNVVSSSTYGVFGYSNQSSLDGVCTFNRCIFKNITISGGGGYGQGFTSTYSNDGNGWVFNTCSFYNIKNTTAPKSFFGGNATNTLSLINCTIAITDTSNYPTTLFDNTVSLTVKNTIIANFSGGTVNFGSPTVVSNTYNDFYLMTSAPSGSNNITTDPLLVDAVNGNLNLRPTSPCIDTGTLL